jgi:hypothetical protein
MNLMRYADTQGRDFCVSWMDDGVSFIIRDTDTFMQSVIPMFFKGEPKFLSFKRKLHRWCFHVVMRVKSRLVGREMPQIVFRNENFQRDQPQRLQYMEPGATRASPPIKINISPVSPVPAPDMSYSMSENVFQQQPIMPHPLPLNHQESGEDSFAALMASMYDLEPIPLEPTPIHVPSRSIDIENRWAYGP